MAGTPKNSKRPDSAAQKQKRKNMAGFTALLNLGKGNRSRSDAARAASTPLLNSMLAAIPAAQKQDKTSLRNSIVIIAEVDRRNAKHRASRSRAVNRGKHNFNRKARDAE